ncbi:MAG: hypothetical protein JNM34_09430 [Chthonomonadaceae bacterium]|nr:hypothetical protein [Chthonomonadaceae bacterium]
MSPQDGASGLQAWFQSAHEAREAGLRNCRALIQSASKCIKHVHRKQFAEADHFLKTSQQLVADTKALLSSYPELLYAGFFQDAEKEYVEAAKLIEWVRPGGSDVTEQDLGVSPVSYLNGSAEAASECRRLVLDELRAGKWDEAERLFAIMEGCYEELVTFDFPDGLTGGLRRSCDALRAVIERTRADLTLTKIQAELTTELRLRAEPHTL